MRAASGSWLRAGSLLAAGLCLWLAACGDPRQPHLPRIGPDDVVLAFGDSITHGVGAPSDSQSYPEVLGELIGRHVVRDGVPGEVTAQGLERLPESLDEYQPKLLLLCLGGNDMLRDLDPADTEANLREMIELARERGVAVVLIAVPEPRLIGGVAQFYRRVAEDLGIPLEERVLLDVLKDRDYKSDPIHPNAEGYRRMAQALAELLRDAGAI
jgi:lysophospholipase L1-like esterase